MAIRSEEQPQLGTATAHRLVLRRLVAISWQYWRAGVGVVFLNGLLVGLNVSGLGLAGLGIDVVRYALTPGSSRPLAPLGFSWPDAWSARQILLAVSALIAGVALLVMGLKYVTALASAALSQQIVIDLRTQVYDKLQRLSFCFYDRAASGSLINRAAGDVQAVRTFVDGVLFKIITVLLSLVVYLLYMLQVHVMLTLTCLATVPLLYLGAAWFSRVVQPQYRRSGELGDRMIQVLAENFQGVQVVKGFAGEAEQVARFRQAAEAIHDQKRRIFWQVSTFQPLMGLLNQVNQCVLLAFGGYLVIRGQLSLGAGLFVFANLLHEFANQVGQITSIANTIQTSLAGAERVFEILDAPGELQSPVNAQRIHRARGSIRFEHVSFSYQPGTPVLQDLSFEIRPGECVGIAGLTGAGKTTLLSLIPRFYDVQRGRITFDGHDLRTLALHDLRREIGIVFQDSFLFSNTVAANLAFGQPDASFTSIRAAARLAAADEFIQQLPQGYETVVGEHGSNLSGGQRQRLALARTLLLAPSVLLLDDATAAVDVETEHAIQQALHDVLPGRTALIVSNRLSTLCHTDRILYMQAGRLVASGSPTELLGRDGPFRELVETQLWTSGEHGPSPLLDRRPSVSAASPQHDILPL